MGCNRVNFRFAMELTQLNLIHKHLFWRQQTELLSQIRDLSSLAAYLV